MLLPLRRLLTAVVVVAAAAADDETKLQRRAIRLAKLAALNDVLIARVDVQPTVVRLLCLVQAVGDRLQDVHATDRSQFKGVINVQLALHDFRHCRTLVVLFAVLSTFLGIVLFVVGDSRVVQVPLQLLPDPQANLLGIGIIPKLASRSLGNPDIHLMVSKQLHRTGCHPENATKIVILLYQD